MKRLACALLVAVLVLSGVCGALAVTPLAVETEHLPDYEKTMYLSFIGNCTVNGIETDINALDPSVKIDGDSKTVRFVPLEGAMIDFDFTEGYLYSVSLILDTSIEYVLSNASILYVVFVAACNPALDSESARAIVTSLFDNTNYDAEYNADYGSYDNISERYTLLCAPFDVILTVYPAG